MNPTASRFAVLMGSASLLTLTNALTAQAQMTAQATPENVPEPVINTCSGTFSGVAWAVICACAVSALVSVNSDAEPIKTAKRDAVGFIIPPLVPLPARCG